ncbi:hypothetical protein F4802DRAFT_594480 [Xylaria palmicola]|nr:hypothetical protein F4802DRAFT_594480 [Xylaria palmicola]
MRSGHRIVALGALVSGAHGILVAPNSPCQVNCGNVLDATPVDQIVCDDSDYSTATGKILQSCVACESASTYTYNDGKQSASDLQAMLYNMRYTTDQCVFRLESSPCSTSQGCDRLQDALQYGNLSTTVTPYGYCSLWSDYELDKCAGCLVIDGKSYIRNFINILSGACQHQVQPPNTLTLTGNIFSDDPVNVTSPTNTAVAQANNNVGPLTTGALAGIIIGGIAALLILLGCGVVINGKRRRRNYLRRREEKAKNWPNPQVSGDMYETPLSQRPLRGGWGDSPVSAGTTEGYGAYPYPRYFSPYATQFDSPVSAVEGHGGQMAWPAEKARSIGVALSPDHDDDDAESPWGGDRKGKEKAHTDAGGVDGYGYELQEGVNSAGGYGFPPPPPPSTIRAEAPVLNHPGYGRQGQIDAAAAARRTPSPT